MSSAMNRDTLLLTRSDVVELLGLPECIDAVEKAFRLHAEGKIAPAGILAAMISQARRSAEVSIRLRRIDPKNPPMTRTQVARNTKRRVNAVATCSATTNVR